MCFTLNGVENLKNAQNTCKLFASKHLVLQAEWKGTGMVALCSKLYCGWGEGDEASDRKLSTKGISKRTNDFRRTHFVEMVKHNPRFEATQKSQGTNKGFRVIGGRLFSYAQHKNAMTYLYPKRKVQENGIDTDPLDI